MLEQLRDEMLDWHGQGMSVMEMSHRGKAYVGIAQQAEADLRELMAIPAHYKVLFLQGGATAQFAAIPFNLTAPGATVDYVNTGAWSTKAIAEARRYCTVNVVADAAASKYTTVPAQSEWKRSTGAAYLHYTPNETIGGVEYPFVPDAGDMPLVADFSSSILSRPIDVSRFGVIYAGAQKNIGPAGLVVVIVREDLLGKARADIPTVFDWKAMAADGSMLNTPATYSWYVAGLVFQWIKRQGGVEAMGRLNQAKARKLYDTIDALRLLQEPGHGRVSFVDERAVHAAQRRPRQAFHRRREAGRPGDARRPSLRWRHAREPLQRDADGGRGRARGVHEGIPADQGLGLCSRSRPSTASPCAASSDCRGTGTKSPRR